MEKSILFSRLNRKSQMKMYKKSQDSIFPFGICAMRPLSTLLCLVAIALAMPARAGIILDADFFSTIPHSLVTFETDGSGEPVNLGWGESQDMPYDEYATLGFTFNPGIRWVNDGSDSFDAAQAIGGSPEIGIPSSIEGDYFIDFSVPVRAFGFWVINNSMAVEIPVFEAYGAGGLIETVQFNGAAIDGTIEDADYGDADYGFLGIVADQDITNIHITKEATVLDNFMFSAVPEPTTLLLLGLGAVMLRRRRIS